MKFRYTGDIENRIAFGIYDFSKGECEVEEKHFQDKLLNMPDFTEVKTRAKRTESKPIGKSAKNDEDTTD